MEIQAHVKGENMRKRGTSLEKPKINGLNDEKTRYKAVKVQN